MRSILLIFCMFVAICGASAENVKFNSTTWDMGTVKEDGGVVSHFFEFENTTSRAVVIVGVNASCGCTTPIYSRKPILAGAKSSLEVRFDPMYRPGRVAKEVVVYTSASEEPVVLTLRGTVRPRNLTIEEIYPYKPDAAVRISDTFVMMGNVQHDDARQSEVKYINTTRSALKIEFRPRTPNPYLSLRYDENLGGEERASLNIGYKVSARDGFYGLLTDTLDIYINGVKSPMTVITKAYSVDKFPTSVKKGAPSASFSKKMINFETFNTTSEVQRRTFTVENRGTQRLVIRKAEVPEALEVRVVKADVMQRHYSPVKECVIEAGERVTIEVALDPAKFGIGANVEYVTFILNAKDQPVERVKIVGRCEVGL